MFMDFYVCGAYGQGGLDRPASIPPFLGAREGRFPSFFFGNSSWAKRNFPTTQIGKRIVVDDAEGEKEKTIA